MTATGLARERVGAGEPDEFAARARATLAGLEGVVGLMARHFGSGRELRFRADEVFPTASVFKLPLLYALYRLAEAGEIDLGRRVPIGAEGRVPGSGVLQDLDPGLEPTVRDLAVLMTVVSDNLATDLIYALVGRDRLAAALADLGLGRTSIPLDCRGIFLALAGMDAADPAATYEALNAALRDRRAPDGCLAYADDARNNTSSPADTVALLTAIEEGRGLTPDGRAAVLAILGRQKYTTIIPLLLPEGAEVAHKTGSLRGIRNDAGIVEGPMGRYALALYAKRLADEVEGVRRLAELSRLVWQEFEGEGA